jgi:uncharacterized protein involved in tolerance to divalent cations
MPGFLRRYMWDGKVNKDEEGLMVCLASRTGLNSIGNRVNQNITKKAALLPPFCLEIPQTKTISCLQMIKTQTAKLDQLREFVLANHPYGMS